MENIPMFENLGDATLYLEELLKEKESSNTTFAQFVRYLSSKYPEKLSESFASRIINLHENRNKYLAAGAILFNHNFTKVVLVQDYKYRYSFPKGCVEGKETLKQAAIREVYEETNVKLDIVRLQEPLNTIQNSSRFIYLFPVRNVAEGRHLRSNDLIEIKEVNFFDLQKIKYLKLTMTTIKILSYVVGYATQQRFYSQLLPMLPACEIKNTFFVVKNIRSKRTLMVKDDKGLFSFPDFKIDNYQNVDQLCKELLYTKYNILKRIKKVDEIVFHYNFTDYLFVILLDSNCSKRMFFDKTLFQTRKWVYNIQIINDGIDVNKITREFLNFNLSLFNSKS